MNAKRDARDVDDRGDEGRESRLSTRSFFTTLLVRNFKLPSAKWFSRAFFARFACKRSGASRLYYYYFAAFLRAALYHQTLVHYEVDNVFSGLQILPPFLDGKSQGTAQWGSIRLVERFGRFINHMLKIVEEKKNDDRK